MDSKKTGQLDSSSVDLYRDTPVRYLGYANEVGEAFRSIIGTNWVRASYGVAVAYVFADTYDKSCKVYQASKGEEKRVHKTAVIAVDTLIWQMLASVAVPGFTINRTCALSNYLLKNYSKLPKQTRKYTVTAIGLATIPFIIKPIDNLIDHVMDRTYRKYIIP